MQQPTFAAGQTVTTSDEQSSLASCMVRIDAGQQEALINFYDLTVERTFSIACAMLSETEDCEKIVSDVYVSVWNHSDRYEPSHGDIDGWLATLTRKRAIDFLRKGRPAAETHSFIALFGDDSDMHGRLATLSPLANRVLSLAFLQGLSHDEIATATGLALELVKTYLDDALRHLDVLAAQAL